MTEKKKPDPKPEASAEEGVVAAAAITTAAIEGAAGRPKHQDRIDMNDPSLSGAEAVAKNLAAG